MKYDGKEQNLKIKQNKHAHDSSKKGSETFLHGSSPHCYARLACVLHYYLILLPCDTRVIKIKK